MLILVYKNFPHSARKRNFLYINELSQTICFFNENKVFLVVGQRSRCCYYRSKIDVFESYEYFSSIFIIVNNSHEILGLWTQPFIIFHSRYFFSVLKSYPLISNIYQTFELMYFLVNFLPTDLYLKYWVEGESAWKKEEHIQISVQWPSFTLFYIVFPEMYRKNFKQTFEKNGGQYLPYLRHKKMNNLFILSLNWKIEITTRGFQLQNF